MQCSSPFGNCVSCSLLTSWLSSLSCLSYGHVICSTTCLWSFNCLSCGDVICDTSIICLTTYTTIGTTNGCTLPLIIFSVLTYVFSYSFFTLELKAPPSSSLFFLLNTLLKESVVAFFLFSNVVFISSLFLLTLASGFYGFSFQCTNKYWMIFANTKAYL